MDEATHVIVDRAFTKTVLTNLGELKAEIRGLKQTMADGDQAALTKSELARRLGKSTRQLSRDFRAIRAAGIELEPEHTSGRGAYYAPAAVRRALNLLAEHKRSAKAQRASRPISEAR